MHRVTSSMEIGWNSVRPLPAMGTTGWIRIIRVEQREEAVAGAEDEAGAEHGVRHAARAHRLLGRTTCSAGTGYRGSGSAPSAL